MKKICVFPLLMLALSACGPLGIPPNVQRSKVMDGVKSISPSVSGLRDGSTLLQTEYTISDQQRLLLRYEDFSKNAGQVDTTSQKVYVQIQLKNDADAPAALTSMQLCPLSRSWMMLATWEWAVPMKQEKWSQPGGDFDPQGCINAQPSPNAADPKALLFFDATNWVKSYAYGRSQNFGFILISSGSFKIFGDSSAYNAPTLQWQERQGSATWVNP